MPLHSFRSSLFGSRLLALTLCGAAAVAACSNSSGGTGGTGNAAGATGNAAGAGQGNGGSAGAATAAGGSGGTSVGTAGGGLGTAGGSSAGTGGVSVGGTSGASSTGGASGGAPAGGSGGATAHTGPWKIMPLGDSTTASVCYRVKLWGKLQAAGKTNVDFVGTEKSVSCGDPAAANFDQDNEGHPCYIVSNIINMGNKPSCTGSDFMSNSTDLARWFDTQMPDIVLMHFGTNDVWNGYGPTQILPAFKAILDKIRTRNPNVKMFVAQIIPLHPDTAKDYDTLAKTLNSAIPAWATTNSTAASPIVVVDQFTGYDIATDNQVDGVHPNPTGSDKIAQKWFDAIQSLL